MHLNVIGVDASKEFYEVLKDISEPETKRKAIGAKFGFSERDPGRAAERSRSSPKLLEFDQLGRPLANYYGGCRGRN